MIIVKVSLIAINFLQYGKLKIYKLKQFFKHNNKNSIKFSYKPDLIDDQKNEFFLLLKIIQI